MADSALFVRIPRTASTSIWNTLSTGEHSVSAQCFNQWLEASRSRFPQFQRSKLPQVFQFSHELPMRLLHRGVMTLDDFRSCWTFSIVRNPWDRMVSMYHFYKQHRGWPYEELVRRHAPTFSHYVSYCVSANSPPGGTSPEQSFQCGRQLDWLRINGKESLDYVGHFEDLALAWHTIAARIGCRNPLLHQRKTRHQHYRKYFSRSDREKVAQRYAEEIDRFQFVF